MVYCVYPEMVEGIRYEQMLMGRYSDWNVSIALCFARYERIGCESHLCNNPEIEVILVSGGPLMTQALRLRKGKLILTAWLPYRV